jgi:hypothetical protein
MRRAFNYFMLAQTINSQGCADHIQDSVPSRAARIGCSRYEPRFRTLPNLVKLTLPDLRRPITLACHSNSGNTPAMADIIPAVTLLVLFSAFAVFVASLLRP